MEMTDHEATALTANCSKGRNSQLSEGNGLPRGKGLRGTSVILALPVHPTEEGATTPRARAHYSPESRAPDSQPASASHHASQSRSPGTASSCPGKRSPSAEKGTRHTRWYRHSMEQYSAFKRKEIPTSDITGMNPDDTLSEISQTASDSAAVRCLKRPRPLRQPRARGRAHGELLLHGPESQLGRFWRLVMAAQPGACTERHRTARAAVKTVNSTRSTLLQQ